MKTSKNEGFISKIKVTFRKLHEEVPRSSVGWVRKGLLQLRKVRVKVRKPHFIKFAVLAILV